MNPNLAIILENEIYYHDTFKTQANYHPDILTDKLEDYISFVPISPEPNLELNSEPNQDSDLDNKILDIIIDTIIGNQNVDNKIAIHTGIVSHILDDLYLICHIRPTEELYKDFKKNGDQFNGIASYLSDDGLRLYKKAVLLKLDTRNNLNKIVPISLSNVVDVFAKKFVHKGVSVNPTNANMGSEYDFYQYMFNPLDCLSATHNMLTNYKYYEIEILGKLLMIFHDTRSDIVNPICSRLAGHRVFGRCYIGLRDPAQDIHDTEYHYIDIDIDIVRKLVRFLAANDLTKLKLTDKETIGCDTIDNKRVYNNFYKILSRR